MSEIALISSRKNRLESAAKKGNKKAKVALDLANSPNTFLSAVQIGITLIGILTGIFSGDKITADVEQFIASFSFLKAYSDTIAVGIVVIILTFFSLVLGELLPKRIGLNHPEGIAKIVAVPMRLMSTITKPFIWLLTVSTEFLLKVLQIKPTTDGKVTEEEIKAIIKEGTEVGEVQEIEQDIVERVFHIGDRKVNSLMTHRSYVVYLSLEDTKEQIKNKIIGNLYAIYPVCVSNLDNIIGLVTLKDLFGTIDNPDFDLKKIMKEPLYFIEYTSAYKALDSFKKSKKHTAFVTDEYALFQGVISLNDILEALVGAPSDFDENEFRLEPSENGKWIVDGGYSFHDCLNFFQMGTDWLDYDVATVSGFIIKELGVIPKVGQKMVWNKLKFEVTEMDGLKVGKVVISNIKEE